MRPEALVAAAVVVALSACSGASTRADNRPTPAKAANANEVVISDYKFFPQTLTVPVGTTVTWVNHDLAPHTATHRAEGDLAFDSGSLVYHAVFVHTFKTAGSYDYLCMLHPGMLGWIIVQ